MSLNRREMLRLGAMAPPDVILSSAASSSVLPSFVCPPAAPGPIRWRRFRPLRRPLRPRLRRASIRSCSPAPRPRSTSTRSAPRDTIGIVDFSKPSSEPRFHVVDLASGKVESHLRRPRPRLRPRPFGLRRALLERFRLLRDVERDLHHRRLLRRQVRAFDEGPRPRLVATTMPSRARSSSTTPGMPRPT